MAGGIDWLRWHHGSVSDSKFQLVAKRAGSSVAEVIAVWACLLERASMQEVERGCLGTLPDFEAMDCSLGMEDGRALAIFSSLRQRSLIDDSLRLTGWAKRQPKREREGDSSAERTRAYRARQRSAANPLVPAEPSVTPCDATTRQVTPREEERREEEKESSVSKPSASHPTSVGALFDRFWQAYPKKKAKDAALKAFAKRKPTPELLARMLNAIEAQRASDDWQRDGGQFIPHPATWLNGGRWDDETVAELSPQAVVNWWDSTAGIIAKGVEKGCGEWSEATWMRTGVQWPTYKAKVFAAVGPGPWNAPLPASLAGVVSVRPQLNGTAPRGRAPNRQELLEQSNLRAAEQWAATEEVKRVASQ